MDIVAIDVVYRVDAGRDLEARQLASDYFDLLAQWTDAAESLMDFRNSHGCA